ncbi:MAG: hypothetical protein KAJ06_01040 [Gammaproteobacteria bacterium]|nr:hypothetical protein [Gammaproteobacteria bacterium]
MKIIKHVLVVAILSGPAQLRAERFGDFDSDEQEIISSPTPDIFSVCFDHSCYSVETLSITGQEWTRVTSLLDTPRESAAKERHAIAAAIALMEEIVGQRTGTGQDLGRNLRGFWKIGQMDCIDESTNTTTYLYMLEQAGYLKWHKLVDRSTRFGIFAGMPHTTAVIEEINNHTRYAVDSWFFDNGTPPAIVKLSAWKKGWNPGDTPE